MKKTASPSAKSKARMRSRPVSPVTAFVVTGGRASIG
jgi:hypothetical protein